MLAVGKFLLTEVFGTECHCLSVAVGHSEVVGNLVAAKLLLAVLDTDNSVGEYIEVVLLVDADIVDIAECLLGLVSVDTAVGLLGIVVPLVDSGGRKVVVGLLVLQIDVDLACIDLSDFGNYFQVGADNLMVDIDCFAVD